MDNQTIGAEHELKFWKNFIHSEQFKSWLSDEITPELLHGQPDVVTIIKNTLAENPNIEVLDAGSGVMSILKGLVPDENIKMIDVLGYSYMSIFNYEDYKMGAPVPLAAEDLDIENKYDIVHMRNAIDHCQDPALAYIRLLASVKHGGLLIIHGFTNEAVNESWQGFHQWNFNITGKNDPILHCTGKGGKIKLTAKEPYFSSVYKLPDNGKEWFVWVVKKGVE